MRYQIHRSYWLLIAIGAVVSYLLVTGASRAQDAGYASAQDPEPKADLATSATPVPGGPGFISQTALAFRGWPRENTPTAFSGIMLYNPDSATSHAYEAMINLPHGATITKFTVWYYDNNATSDLWVVIAKAGVNGSGVKQIARVDSTGSTSSIRFGESPTALKPILEPVVDNQNYFYWVEAFLPPGSTSGVISFQINYSYPAYLPGVTR